MRRVGIISLYHESNTFVAGRTTIEDFRAGRLLVGDAARSYPDWGNHEIAGFIKGLQVSGIEPVLLMAATATPGPIVAREAFDQLCNSLLAELASAPELDGLLLAPHGAAVAEGHPDADGTWLTRVRDAVGPDLPIIATLDPHANLSRAMVDATDALISYRTNPHLDQFDRGLEAAGLMARTLRGEIRPVQAAALPPLTINIERQHTAASPMADLAQAARLAAATEGVLSTSLLLGFPYADVAEVGSGAVVVTDNDPALARVIAASLGQRMWESRQQLVGHLIDPARAIEEAARLPGTVCLLDMGDNVGGGSAADGTCLAHLLHTAHLGRSFVCLYDPNSAGLAKEAGVGATLTLAMGGHSETIYGTPLITPVVVRSLFGGQFTDLRARHGGITHYDIGPGVVVETESGLTIMLTTRRAFPVSLRQLTSCGIDPSGFRIIVAKGVHAPVAAYEEVCSSFIRVNTPGLTSADLSAFRYVARRKPLFPLENPAEPGSFVYQKGMQ